MKKVNILTANRKGQITLFIIIGLIFLMIFMALFYIANIIKEARIEKEARKTTSVLSKSVMQYYVSDCLKDIVKEGFIMLGKQGGYFYENQSGYSFTTELPRMSFLESNVSYLIYPIKGYYSAWWPCFSYCKFGTDINPTEKYTTGYSGKRLPFLATQQYSIKSQLVKYIQDEIGKCVNLTQLSSQFPGYSISGEDIDTEINFGSFSVNVKLKYPIKMQFLDYEPILEIYGFEATVPIRFSTIYSKVSDLIEKEIYFLNADPEKEAVSLLQYNPEITFSKIEHGFDDIFILNDSFSMIDGKSYIFQFARRNRPPVLNYISRSPSYLYDKADSSKDIYDYLAVPISGLDLINITPNVTDPDEDDVYLSSESDIPNLNKANFQNSLIYTINSNGIGFHNVTVTAFDGELPDKQTVRILVDKPLSPNATFYNLYGGNVYSREDPFFLNTTATIESLDPFAKYIFKWNDFVFFGGASTKTEGFILTTNSSCIVLPSGEDCSLFSINIENITNYPYIMAPSHTNIELYVNLSYSQLSQTNNTNIPVIRKQCIPYRNPNSEAYPYHTIQNPFFANHTCCLGDINDYNTWQLAGTDVICHQELSCEGAIGLKKIIKQWHCSGERGNICNGAVTDAGESNICGCRESHNECNNVEAYGLKEGKGWCYGNEGCTKFCSGAVVDLNGNNITDQGDACGCSWQYLGARCDEDFNNSFNGTCGIFGCSDKPW